RKSIMIHHGTRTRLIYIVVATVVCGIVGTRDVLSASVAPEMVTLEGVLDPGTDDTLAFTPDGKTVFFDRKVGQNKYIMISHQSDGKWITPQIASFSGTWLDRDPAVSVDGSFLIFSSDRPVTDDGKPVVFVDAGKSH